MPHRDYPKARKFLIWFTAYDDPMEVTACSRYEAKKKAIGLYITRDGERPKIMYSIDVEEILAGIKRSIKAEDVSTSELAVLQSLAKYIDPSETELLQWAGVNE